MSYDSGQDQYYGKGGRGRSNRGYRGGYNAYNQEDYQPPAQSYTSEGKKELKLMRGSRGKRYGAQHTKERVKEELNKEYVEKRTYSKFTLLEMFTNVELAESVKRMESKIDEDILVKHCQDPVLLFEQEPLTLEELKPKKGDTGGKYRNKFQNRDQPADDYKDDEDPEWLDFEPDIKKFDFSKHQPLEKMYDDGDADDFGALEDDEDDQETTESTNKPQEPEMRPISIEELEKQTFTQIEQNTDSSQNKGFVQDKFDAKYFGQNAQTSQPVVSGMFMNQNWGAQPPFGQTGQTLQNQANQMSQFSGGYPGFEDNDPFGSAFGGAFGMTDDEDAGFGQNVFSSPFQMQPEFDPMNPFGSTQSRDQPESLHDIFGFGSAGNQFMQQDQDDDEDDDWLDDQMQETQKHQLGK